jgi:hypothetical protein
VLQSGARNRFQSRQALSGFENGNQILEFTKGVITVTTKMNQYVGVEYRHSFEQDAGGEGSSPFFTGDGLFGSSMW